MWQPKQPASEVVAILILGLFIQSFPFDRHSREAGKNAMLPRFAGVFLIIRIPCCGE
jgi:hypothetical protein